VCEGRGEGGACRLLPTVFTMALTGQPWGVVQPIMPLTQDELLELLKMFDGTAAGGTTVFAHGGSAWKDREFFDMNRDQLLTRILRSQPGPTDDYQYFTQTMRSELSLEVRLGGGSGCPSLCSAATRRTR
jgi:hypothetical protein